VVLEAGFGDYCGDPPEIASRVAKWLQDEPVLFQMSRAARKAGHPHAADDIVKDIGFETVTWMEMNERWKDEPMYKPLIELGHTLVLDSYLKNDDYKTSLDKFAAQSKEDQNPKDATTTKRTLVTAAGVGVGAAFGAVMAGPLLPIGLVLGGAIIPALPVGLAVGGTVSGLAANKLAWQSMNATPKGEASTDDEERKEGEEKDGEGRNAGWFGWRAGEIDETPAPTMGENRPSWFGWTGRKEESLTAAAATTTENKLVPDPVQS
jgi:hypothetical protein